MDSGDDGEGRRALLEECAGGDELEGEGEEVEDEKDAELDATCGMRKNALI